MAIATIAPTGNPEPTGDEVVSGEGRNELGWGVEGAESCTGTCVCGIWVVREVPVRVIMRGRSGAVEVVVRTFSVGRTGEAKSEGNGVGEGSAVCEGEGVEGGGVCEEDGATITVMIGAAVVDECSPMLLVFPTSILVDTAAVVGVNHTVTSGLLVCSSTPSSLLSSPQRYNPITSPGRT